MSHNLCREEFVLSSEPWTEIELSFYEVPDSSMANTSRQYTLAEGDKMICRQCFSAKTDSKHSRMCQNKRCLFFEKTRPPPSSLPQSSYHFETIPNGDKYEMLQRSDSQGSLSDDVTAFTGNLSISSNNTRWPALYGSGSLWDSSGLPNVVASKSEAEFDRKRFYSANNVPATTALPHATTNRNWRSDHIRHGSFSLPASNNLSENEDDEDETFLPASIMHTGNLQEMTSTRNDFSRFPLSTTLSVSGGNHLKERAFSSNAFSSSNSIFSSSSSRSTPLPEKRDMSSLSSVLGITSRPSSVGFGWSYSTPSPRIPKPVDGPIKFEPDTFSRKVFVGGLPPDIDEDHIKKNFQVFGDLIVDWPHKVQTKALYPPKGYAFLLFSEEESIHKLVMSCLEEDDKHYMYISSPTYKEKKVQVRPWRISDSDYIMDNDHTIDTRKTIFVGGVPRPLKAVELAEIMNEKYGSVCYAGIDIDAELKYPKGAARVTFSSQASFISAVSARFVQIIYGDVDKRVEIKPYVLDDQMCDECHGVQCAGKYAPFFCGNVNCLQYYCEHCWATVHSMPGRHNHRPLVKEGFERPRAMTYKGKGH
ncbi:cytoplasmic polyadenylation element-binding protein 1-like isoform X2 [Dysidea avara]|uniref:cytoplasmic polyadenylation element-binding protein 1-like isoform X2 n=1 Tax=Dysidea avara TaxID=196820 RepID=UPI003325BABE